ncbi:MAG: thiamine-phosphate kinase [Bacteroidales bacterium]
MNISELGKFGLMDRIYSNVKLSNPDTIKALTDDAVEVQSNTSQSLVSNNMMLEGIHFDLTYFPMKHLGYKAAVSSFTDIYAMNGQPTQLLVSLGVSKRFSVENIDEFYEGVLLACQHNEVDLCSTKLTSSLTGFTISLSSLGQIDANKVCYKSGAKVGDLICVSGSLGAAYMGLLLLDREKKVLDINANASPQLAGNEYIIGKYLKPEAPRATIKNLGKADLVPTAMTSIIDGLASDVLQLGKQSGVGINIYLSKIPIAKKTFDMAEEMNFDAVTAALNGGDDYELLFTLPLTLHDKVKDIGGIDVIGHTVDASKGTWIIPPSGEPVSLQAQGFFAQKEDTDAN